MTSASPDQLSVALDITERLVAAVRHDQWPEPTPCTEWSVRELVGHVVAGNRVFAAILREEPALRTRSRLQLGDHLGDEPVDAYRESADAMLEAFRQPGVMERLYRVPFGTVPGLVALHLRITEILTHGWDLARATGQTVSFPDDLVEQELEFTGGQLEEIPPDRHPFAPPQPVPGNAPPIDRLAALLGRPVAGPPNRA